jgi:hypothetical protein
LRTSRLTFAVNSGGGFGWPLAAPVALSFLGAFRP